MFIELTDNNCTRVVSINVQMILSFHPYQRNLTRIWFAPNYSVTVSENYDQVKELISKQKEVL